MRFLYYLIGIAVWLFLLIQVIGSAANRDFVQAIFWSLWLLFGSYPAMSYGTVYVLNGRNGATNGESDRDQD
jgi:hypothetical protein